MKNYKKKTKKQKNKKTGCQRKSDKELWKKQYQSKQDKNLWTTGCQSKLSVTADADWILADYY